MFGTTKLIVLTMATAVGLSAADNSIGIWKRNEAQSKTTSGLAAGRNPITSLIWNIEAIDEGAKLIATGSRKDGSRCRTESTIKYDGKEYPVTGAPWDRMVIKQIDANTFEWGTRSTAGKHRSKARVRVSDDGKTMTMNTTGTDSEGHPFSSVNVYQRQ
jgi:hypothetical protein